MASIAVIAGSVRSQRHGIKVARWVLKELQNRGHDATLVDPKEMNLPMLDKMYKEMDSPPKELAGIRGDNIRRRRVRPSHSRVQPQLFCGIKEHAGLFPRTVLFQAFCNNIIFSWRVWRRGGCKPPKQVLAELGTPAIPSQLPISKVHESFGEDGGLADKNYERRLARFLSEFEWYVDAMQRQRKKGRPIRGLGHCLERP